MVVTASLARGAVRAAIQKHSAAVVALRARVDSEPLVPPSTMRRFPQWFRSRVAIHEKDALLIVHGMTRRRVGAFVAFHPHFNRTERGWNMAIRAIRLECSPGRMEAIEHFTLPVEISGHALERMFQRTHEIAWKTVRDCLAGATLLLASFAPTWLASGARQCAIPAERGLLIGQVGDGILHLRTFLAQEDISPKWWSLMNEINLILADHLDDLNAAALVPDVSLRAVLDTLIRRPDYRWLFRDYVPGTDPLEDAWRSRGE